MYRQPLRPTIEPFLLYPLSCHEHFLHEMPPVNVYHLLQGILEIIEPGNCAIILCSFSSFCDVIDTHGSTRAGHSTATYVKKHNQQNSFR